MRTNNTSVIYNAQEVKQINTRFQARDASQLLNLFLFYGEDIGYEPSNEIAFADARENFANNLTRRPEFWGVGDEFGAPCDAVDRQRDSLFLAAVGWMVLNEVVDVTATGAIKLNPRRVDYAAFEASQQADGVPPCDLTRAQCLLTEDAPEITTSALFNTRLNQRGIADACAELETMKAKRAADPKYCTEWEIMGRERAIRDEASAANDDFYQAEKAAS